MCTIRQQSSTGVERPVVPGSALLGACLCLGPEISIAGDCPHLSKSHTFTFRLLPARSASAEHLLAKRWRGLGRATMRLPSTPVRSSFFPFLEAHCLGVA